MMFYRQATVKYWAKPALFHSFHNFQEIEWCWAARLQKLNEADEAVFAREHGNLSRVLPRQQPFQRERERVLRGIPILSTMPNLPPASTRDCQTSCNIILSEAERFQTNKLPDHHGYWNSITRCRQTSCHRGNKDLDTTQKMFSCSSNVWTWRNGLRRFESNISIKMNQPSSKDPFATDVDFQAPSASLTIFIFSFSRSFPNWQYELYRKFDWITKIKWTSLLIIRQNTNQYQESITLST